MTTFKSIEYNNPDSKYMHDISTVKQWLASTIGENGLFVSLRWNKYDPTTRQQLISKIHCTFNQYFRELLGTHWVKLYIEHFNFVAIQEFGHSDEPHAHAGIGVKTDKFTVNDLITTMYAIEDKIQMEVCMKKKEDEKVKLIGKYQDSLVFSPMYAVSGVSGYISKEFSIECKDVCAVNAYNFICTDEIFPVRY